MSRRLSRGSFGSDVTRAIYWVSMLFSMTLSILFKTRTNLLSGTNWKSQWLILVSSPITWNVLLMVTKRLTILCTLIHSNSHGLLGMIFAGRCTALWGSGFGPRTSFQFFSDSKSVNTKTSVNIKIFKVKGCHRDEVKNLASPRWVQYAGEENGRSLLLLLFFLPTTNRFTDYLLNTAFMFITQNNPLRSWAKNVSSFHDLCWSRSSSVTLGKIQHYTVLHDAASVRRLGHLRHESGERPGRTSSELFRGEVVPDGSSALRRLDGSAAYH